jgi:hypothetical protein
MFTKNSEKLLEGSRGMNCEVIMYVEDKDNPTIIDRTHPWYKEDPFEALRRDRLDNVVTAWRLSKGGLSQQEISEVMGLSLSSIRAYIKDARKLYEE